MAYSTQNGTALTVTNIGAILDGVTDNKNALQRAVNSLYSKGGGTLFFPKGTCYWSGTLDVTGYDITFLGEDGARLLAARDESVKKINISGAKRVSFYGLTLDGNRTGINNDSNQRGFINTFNTEDIRIENCNFYNSRNSLIYLGGGTKFATIDNNYFTGHFCGIFSYVNSGENDSERFIITNNSFSNTWVGPSVGESACIKLQTQQPANWSGFSKGHIITDNAINSQLQMGIEIWGRGRNHTVCNNSITSTDWGISLDNQEFCTVDGNTVKGVNYMGIECATVCNDIVISNNVINGYTGYLAQGATRNTAYGMSNSNQSCNRLVYHGNIVEGCTIGFNGQNSSDLIANGNIFRDNGINVFFQASQNVQLHGNLFDTGINLTSYHVFFDASTKNLTGFHFSDNKFRGKTTDQSIFYYNAGSSYSVYDVCVENNVTDSTTSGGYGTFIGGQFTPRNYVYRNNFGPSGATAGNSIIDISDTTSPYQTTDINDGFQYYTSTSWTIPNSGITGSGIWLCVWSGGAGIQNNVRLWAGNYFNQDGNQYQNYEFWATMVPYVSANFKHTLYATPGYHSDSPYIKQVKTISNEDSTRNSIWLRLGNLTSGASGQKFLFKYSEASYLPSVYSTLNEPTNTTNNANLYLDSDSNFYRAYKYSNGFSVGESSTVGILSSTSGRMDLLGTGFGFGGTVLSKNGVIVEGVGGNASYIEVGAGRSSNGFAYIDLVGDTTYTDYALRFIRDTNGANSTSSILHRGTGTLQIKTEDSAPLVLYTNNTERLRATSAGNVGINVANPNFGLHINGSVGLSGITTSTTANVGGATLPANPVGFITVNITGGNFKIPYYNI